MSPRLFLLFSNSLSQGETALVWCAREGPLRSTTQHSVVKPFPLCQSAVYLRTRVELRLHGAGRSFSASRLAQGHQPKPPLPGPARRSRAGNTGHPRGWQQGEQNRPKYLLKLLARVTRFIIGKEGTAGGKGAGEASPAIITEGWWHGVCALLGSSRWRGAGAAKFVAV